MNNNYKIYFDIDNTLTDYTGGLKKLNLTPRDTTKDEYEHFWSEAEWLPLSQNMIKFSQKYFPTEILTASPDYPSPKNGKLKWIKNNIGNIPVIFTKSGKEKGRYANKNTILIDDKQENINHFVKQGGIGILFKNNPEEVVDKLLYYLKNPPIKENDFFGLKEHIRSLSNEGIEPIIFTDKKHNYKKSFSHKLYDTLNEITLNTSNAVSVVGNEYKGEFDIDVATYEYVVQKFDKIFDDGLLYNISFSPKGIEIDVPMGTTSPKNFIKILSTMYKIILDFIEKVKPKYLGISSKDNGEDKNYHMLYNRLTSNNNIPGYFKKNSNLNLTTPDGDSGRIIVLKKKLSSSESNIPLNEGQLTDRQLLLDQIKSLTKYMIDKGMNIQPLPKLKIIDNDEENANDFFGKTGYYDPNNNVIVVYTLNRLPKEVVKTICHEMIHRIQNNENRLNGITTTNINEDDYLREIEREAYEQGGLIFREWENHQKKPLNEGRYDKLTTMISSDIFKKWKQGFEAGKKYAILDTFYEGGDVKLTVVAKIFFIPGFKKYRVDGSMGEDGETLLVDFKIDPTYLPDFWEDISMDLRDVVRHEIEHSTQTSNPTNSRLWKYMEDDTLARKMINAKLISKSNYFKLKKEVDANLQGLYLKAKKSKQPFSKLVNDYLDLQDITPEQKEEILNIWRNRIPALSLPKI